MTSEPQRLQYLEAMGLTAWVARYALPNARPTEACDWAPPETPAAEPPGERLHALLDEAAKAPAPRPAESAQERVERPQRPGKARALLGEVPTEEGAPTATPPAEPEAPREALRFAFQVACLEGRWLLLLPGRQAPGRSELALLGNLLRAAGIPAGVPGFEAFRWPLEEGLPVTAPLEEAREGLQAFVAGAHRRGWAPERLLVFGGDEVLERVLTLEAGQCPLLGLPAWQGPALGELAGSAEAKRALLPRLDEWRRAWQATTGEAEGDD
ncbi:hypothetical protein [Halomonas ramblicola]|uniref:hypothetical protein n=1 Tax=Halomonas ramblicola TaxID=747349 RepID=UPI0025B45CDC|nr:hypothetical protein [Halomonas ramblicola]MDN3521309.1 hypothetical protein [Halomonas ramblicola]